MFDEIQSLPFILMRTKVYKQEMEHVPFGYPASISRY